MCVCSLGFTIIRVNDADSLLALTDEGILREGGNGAMEIRHFLAVMGAMPGGSGEVIAYDAWEGAVTGLGFAQMRPAA